MAYQWLSTALRTGDILADLPELKCDSITSQLMAYTSAEASLPLPTAPKNWERATLHGASTLILADGDFPLWGGMVLKPMPDFTDTMPLSLATPEAYFDRRFVGDKIYTQVGQNLIVKDLVETYAAQGSNGGIPIRVEILNGGDGKPRDREYKDGDDKTLYSVLQELSGVIDGPEWTIGWEWLHDPERVTMILYVGDHVGSTITPGMQPEAVFEMPGSVTRFQAPRDYSSSRGATDVMAVSTAQADARPQSPHIVTADPDRPTFEDRFTPSASILDENTLTGHAQARAKALAGGTRSLSLSARADAYPRLGREWRLGDQVGFKVTAPAFPRGIEGTLRPVGWELKLGQSQIVTPVLMGDAFGGA